MRLWVRSVLTGSRTETKTKQKRWIPPSLKEMMQNSIVSCSRLLSFETTSPIVLLTSEIRRRQSKPQFSETITAATESISRAINRTIEKEKKNMVENKQPLT